MHPKSYDVYIMTNKWHTTLYVGMTGDLYVRVYDHKTGKGSKFTKQYKCTKLVYFEEHRDVNECIAREKELKGWSRKKKEELINSVNPEWKDLAEGWYDDLQSE